MKEWTLAERYRVLKDKSELELLYNRTKQSLYRQAYHVQPITGLSSDPNGFIYHQGLWHLFYQWCPWGAVHGLKYWYHTVSADLIHWQNQGIGLAPDTRYDNKGVHSGSGFSEGSDFYLFYTGNHRDENWIRTPYTCAAKVNEAGEIKKLSQPLFGPHPDYTEHQRDPKIVYHEAKQSYYILLGAQSKELKGKVLVYKSKHLLEDWHFAGELRVPGYEDLGGMWECPSIAHIDGKDVLVFSPQYTKLPGRSNNTNHNIYLIGRMDYDRLTFTAEGPYRFLDYGFDFYAAQFAANVQEKDRAVLTAWIGLPDNHYPTENEDWEGSLTLPRELRIVNGRLRQLPLAQIKELRQEKLQSEQELPRVCEIQAINKGADFCLKLFARSDGSGGLIISYDVANNSCLIDRSQMAQRFNRELGEQLTIPLDSPLTNLAVFVDRSSVELFINQGEATFTSHLYPVEEEHTYTVSGELDVAIWTLKTAVSDEFII